MGKISYVVSNRKFKSTLSAPKRAKNQGKQGAVMMFKYGKRFGFAPLFDN